MKSHLFKFFASMFLTQLAVAAGPSSDAESLGFSVDRLSRIHDMIQQRIDNQKLAGAIALVAREGHVVYFEALGMADIEAHHPMSPDTLFRMASMSKPVTGVGILILAEEGRLKLSDPISKYIPEFEGMKVAVGEQAAAPGKPPAASGAASPETEPALRDITIRDLLTHTSGLGSGPASDMAIKKIKRTPQDTLETYIPKLGHTPLDFQPGTKWFYSGLAGFDTLGRVIEIVSGKKLDVFLAERLFAPLGMTSTSFNPPPADRERLATLYLTSPTGLVRFRSQEVSYSPDHYFSGSSGLVSSAADYFHFAQMLANGGEFNGARILSPRMVELMGSEQIPDTLPGRSTGEAWGFGVRVITQGAGNGTLLSGGSFGWSGSAGTHFWVDPKNRIVAIFMTQLGNAGGSGAETARAFETAVMQSVVRLGPLGGPTPAQPQQPVKRPVPSALTMPELKLNPSPKYWERNRMFQGIPTIERTPGGRLWAAWYAGPIQEANEGNYIILVTSGDDGKTWSRPVAVCDNSTYYDGTSWDPRLWRGPDGSFWFTITRTLEAARDGSKVTSWSFRAKDPENPYTAWDEPLLNALGVSLNKPTVLRDGSIIEPVDDRRSPENLWWWMSKDGGHYFSPYANVMTAEDKRSDQRLRKRAEHMLVQRRDGSLWMLMRTEYGIAQSESFDEGKTWNECRPFTDKMAVNTRFYLRKLKSGNLLLVLNDDPKARNNMVAMLSEDDGKTWPYKLTIDERKAVTYPDGTETEDGLIYVIYDWGRYLLDKQEILFAKITEADVKAGKLVDPRSSLKNSIDKLAPYGGGVHRDWEPLEYEKEHAALKQEIEKSKS